MKKPSAYVLAVTFFFVLTGCAPQLTQLETAAQLGDVKQIETLLKQGANINEGSPLPMAIYSDASIDTVRLLLDKGADINREWHGSWWKPIHIAAERGNENMVKLLIDRGADVTVPLSQGKTASIIAEEKGYTSIARLLKEEEEKHYKKLFHTKKENALLPSAPVEKYAAAIIKSDIDGPLTSKVRPNRNSYAIVIGIEHYRQKLPKADFAVSDAKLVSEYLSKVMGYPEENIVTLTNEHASKSDFEKYFEKWLSNNAEKDSTVFIYYSGHGAPNTKTSDAYLVPYDGDPSFIEQTGYPLKKLYESLNKLQAREIIVALDSCFSGAGGRSVIAKGSRPLVMNLQSNMVLSKNMMVLSASSGDQTSSTYDEKGHGLFTYFLLKGIKNEDVVKPDGSIKMDNLFGYIKPQVERIARKQYNNEQTPQLMRHKESLKD